MTSRISLVSFAVCAACLAMQVQAADTTLPVSVTLAPLESHTALGDNLDANQNFDHNLWSRIRSGFQMSAMDTELVRQHEASFVRNPAYIKRVAQRARPYLYHIVQEVERRGMPLEIALLPIVESAFNPTAYSPAAASGLWQFIPSTGRTYGLEQTWWYDGRRDVVAATDAALNYLSYLYSLFGDWELALASYNWGEGAVARSVAKNRAKGLETTFDSLNMPAETRNYVPKLIALRNIVSNPAAYGIELPDIPNTPYFVSISPNRHLDTTLAAQLAGISIDEFTNLNPAYTRQVVASKDSRRILLPIDKADAFIGRLQSYDKPTLSWQAYQAQRGEKLSQIADRYGITLSRLKELNKLSGKMSVASGQILLVPTEQSSVSKAFPAPQIAFAPHLAIPVRPTSLAEVSTEPDKPTVATEADVTLTLAPTDLTLKQPEAVTTANNTTPKLEAPTTPVKVETASNNRPVLQLAEDVQAVAERNQPALNKTDGAYTVAKGDTLYNIAKRHGITVKALLALNALDKPSIKLGQVLRVAGQADTAQASRTVQDQPRRNAVPELRTATYVVRRGDTLISIAKRYKVAAVDLKRWNNNPRKIMPGDQMKVILSKKS